MTVKIKLKNSEDYVLIDDHVYEDINNHPYLGAIDLLNNLRKHSSGCAVFQKTHKNARGTYTTETYYLHKIIAERYLMDRRDEENNLACNANGDKLDCRIENLEWRSKKWVSRKRKTRNKLGYTGVRVEGNRYRATIYKEGKQINIGHFDRLSEAVEAYNDKSRELFGEMGKINKLRKEDMDK